MKPIALYFGEKEDLNGLRHLVKTHFEDDLLEPLVKNQISRFVSQAEAYAHGFFRIKMEILQQADLEPVELDFALGLGELANSLTLIVSVYKKTESLPTPSEKIINDLLPLTERLVAGWVSGDDPRCPGSINPDPDANWEEWNRQISPRRYYEIMKEMARTY